MTHVVLVEWLGRGGIAHVTDAWRRIASEAGLKVTVVGRSQGEIEMDRSVSKRLPTVLGALDAHRRAVRGASAAIRELQPDVVVLQNYQIPVIELGVARAARAAGSRTLLAAHNARPHARFASSDLGLRRLVGSVDGVIAHSHFVAEAILQRHGRRPSVVPLPLPREVIEATPQPMTVPVIRDGERRITSFGVLARAYKGVDTVRAIAASLPAGWHAVVAGRGAGAGTGSGAVVVDRFLSAGELRWLVEQSTAVVLPYRAASQSSAVLMTQALGTVPLASAVGGIIEQIDDGETGVLVPAAAPVQSWIDTLVRIDAQPGRWEAMASAAVTAAREQDRLARAAFLDLVQ